MSEKKVDQVDYTTLDQVKTSFIEKARSTLDFASQFGSVPITGLGASANIFNLELAPFLEKGQQQLGLSIITEGLGTADDARPEDLTQEELCEFWRNIAWKAVSTMTNDAASAGLQSLLLALYLPSSTPESVFTEEFLDGFGSGVVEACKQVGCVYLSGETPQLKSKMVEGKLDIAGAVVALALPGVPPVNATALAPGDSIVLVASSGPHENGFTPLRQLAEKLPQGYRTKLPSGQEYWRAINAGSVLYTPLVRRILEAGITPSGFENITGHGWQKVMRSKLPLRYRIVDPLPVPEIFRFVQEQFGIDTKAMLEIFNYGAGFAIFCRSTQDAERVVEVGNQLGYVAKVVGTVESAEAREVVVEPWGVTLRDEEFALGK